MEKVVTTGRLEGCVKGKEKHPEATGTAVWYGMGKDTTAEGSMTIFRSVWLEHRQNMVSYRWRPWASSQLFRLDLRRSSSTKTYASFIFRI